MGRNEKRDPSLRAAGTCPGNPDASGLPGRRATVLLCRRALARPPSGPVVAQRARPQAQARPERRRNIVQRSAAITAQVRPGGVHAQPMPARLALGIDALYGPTRQVLHGTPTSFSGGKPEKLGGFCGRGSGVSREKHTISRGHVSKPLRPPRLARCAPSGCATPLPCPRA